LSTDVSELKIIRLTCRWGDTVVRSWRRWRRSMVKW